MARFFSELQYDPDYNSLPFKVNDKELERRVIALRSGDLTQVPHISRMLMRIVMKLVSHFAHPARTPDLIGVAMLALVEATTRASTELVDNNIIPYVSVNIVQRMKDLIRDDHTMRVPSRTLRHKRSQGIEVSLFTTRLCSEDEEKPDFVRFYSPAVAKPEHPPLELIEILDKVARTDREKLMIEMRSHRHTLREYAQEAGVSLGTATQIYHGIRDKFKELYKD